MALPVRQRVLHVNNSDFVKSLSLTNPTSTLISTSLSPLNSLGNSGPHYPQNSASNMDDSEFEVSNINNITSVSSAQLDLDNRISANTNKMTLWSPQFHTQL